MKMLLFLILHELLILEGSIEFEYAYRIVNAKLNKYALLE